MTDDTTFDLDTALELLQNRRRRAVIFAIDDLDGDGATIGELADIIAADEHGPMFTTDQRKSVYTGLYQLHLPRLETAGIIEEGDSGVYHLGPNAADALTALNALKSSDASFDTGSGCGPQAVVSF